MEKVDTLLKNGTIVTVDHENSIIESGDIAIKNGKIFDIGKGLDYESDNIENLNKAIVMPGLINTHAHAAMTLFRGLADDLPLMDWLNNHIFPAEASLTEDFVFHGTMLACCEMIKSGTTCFCDMYFFEEQVARAAKETGIKVFAGEGIINFPTPSCKSPEEAIDVMISMDEKYKNDPLVNICAAPHSTYLTDEKYLIKANEYALKNNLPITIHISESASEIAQVKEKTGMTPVHYLNSLGLLNKNLVSVHSVVVDEDEIELFRKNNVKISHNPESNMKLASGIAPVPEYLEAGLCVALGTDGAASNNDLCLLSEMDTAAKLHKVNKLDPTVLSAGEVIRMATIDGAKALGIDSRTGSLEKGKDADIIVFNSAAPAIVPLYNPESHIVYSCSRNEIKDVYILGEKILNNKKITGIDLNSVVESVISIAKKIKN